jgi:sterol desaturase/sphingolipid hydroxylase (fatty acid hydroxylase superfamily)
VAAIVLAIDLGGYAYHRLMHRVRFLWEFHKVHHSAPTLNPFTSFRIHPVDVLLRSASVGLALGAVTGGLALAFGGAHLAADVAAGFGAYALLSAYLVVLNHSHIWLSLGPLEYLLVSPAMHAVHHSRDPRHFDRNFSFVFSIWDVLFRSHYRTARAAEPLTLGVDDADWSRVSVLALLTLPFRNAHRSLRPRKP